MKKAYTLHDLPRSERPRERLMQYGADVLSLQELLALVLGRGISGESVMVTAQKLLAHFGTLENLCNASLQDLQSMKGIGPAKACQLHAVFEIAQRLQNTDASTPLAKKKCTNPQEVFTLLRPLIGKQKKEHFVLLSLDTRNNLLGIDTISVGTINASLVHPRELFSMAIKRHAVSVIIAHNHPSGDPDPSDEDIRVTSKLIEAGKLLGIHVLDHIIVGENRYYSWEEGKLE